MATFEPAPPIVQAAYRSSMDSVRILHDASASPIDIRPSTTTTSPCVARQKAAMTYRDDDDVKAAAPTRASLTNERHTADWQRHTFAAFPSELCELARRSAREQADMGSQSLPPRSAPSAMRTHMRVYGRPCEGDACHAEPLQVVGGAFANVSEPTISTMWTRGSPALIEWEVLDDAVDSIRIELLELGSSATTLIASDIPNNGSFSYCKVPWGMACGDRYFLRFSSTSDPSRYMTTSFFTIGTAP
ncbi:hypothetical protein PINS_up014630 [Pythium insidiosum]|nr:hypothetical protein PINS_up014630 [Pythium insidiosum]